MTLILRLMKALFVLLVVAFGTVSAVATSGDWTQISYAGEVQEPSFQPINLTNAARAPPTASTDVMTTGIAFAQTADLRVFDGAVYALLHPSLAPNSAERIVVRTNSAGESVVSIQGREMSIHASQQATTRGISNDSIASAMDQQPFSYVQNGQTLQGYYDASSNTFVGVGDRITTVIRPRNPTNYLNNLRNRQ